MTFSLFSDDSTWQDHWCCSGVNPLKGFRLNKYGLSLEVSSVGAKKHQHLAAFLKDYVPPPQECVCTGSQVSHTGFAFHSGYLALNWMTVGQCLILCMEQNVHSQKLQHKVTVLFYISFVFVTKCFDEQRVIVSFLSISTAMTKCTRFSSTFYTICDILILNFSTRKVPGFSIFFSKIYIIRSKITETN